MKAVVPEKAPEQPLVSGNLIIMVSIYMAAAMGIVAGLTARWVASYIPGQDEVAIGKVAAMIGAILAELAFSHRRRTAAILPPFKAALVLYQLFLWLLCLGVLGLTALLAMVFAGGAISSYVLITTGSVGSGALGIALCSVMAVAVFGGAYFYLRSRARAIWQKPLSL